MCPSQICHGSSFRRCSERFTEVQSSLLTSQVPLELRSLIDRTYREESATKQAGLRLSYCMVLPGMASDVVMWTPPAPPSLLSPTYITHSDSSPPHKQPADAPTLDSKCVDLRGRKNPPPFWLHKTTRLSRIVTADPKWPTHNTAHA